MCLGVVCRAVSLRGEGVRRVGFATRRVGAGLRFSRRSSSASHGSVRGISHALEGFKAGVAQECMVV
jgi:hypothetical protein